MCAGASFWVKNDFEKKRIDPLDFCTLFDFEADLHTEGSSGALSRVEIRILRAKIRLKRPFIPL